MNKDGPALDPSAEDRTRPITDEEALTMKRITII